MVAGGGGGGGDYCSLGLEETELRLGLPGGNGENITTAKGASCKRGFSETIDLKLKLTTAAADVPEDGGSCGDAAAEKLKTAANKLKVIVAASEAAADPEKPPAPKAQVVGWPPVRSFRKNIFSAKPASKEDGEKPGAVPAPAAAAAAAALVKVSMDGAPYLRKVDLKTYSSYQELSMALEKMFGSFTSGNCESQVRDFVNESKLMDLLNGSEYVPTYEDKDGDWMLVGDVPWEMFVGSCKRLRIMKGSEAVGLAPRAMEKCKNYRSDQQLN